MGEREFAEGMIVLVIGMVVFIVLGIGLVLICSITLQRVKKMKEYCDHQFEKISAQINASNHNTEELTKAVNQLNKNLKTNSI